VRDLGDRGGLTIQLREAIAADEIPGPRILAATAPLTLPHGHCWFLGGQVDSPEEIRAQIECNAAADADLIKIMVSGGSITPGGAHMWESQFDTNDLKVAVQTAHQLGLPVAAHAHGLDSIRSAIDARVDTIEHCTWLDGGMTPVHDEQTVADLVVARIAVCTANSNNWRLMAGHLGEQRAKHIIGRVRWMYDRGVRMITGTDAGLSPFTDTAAALEGLADWGISTSEIIEIATTKTAEAIGLPTTGRIAPGYSADIIVAHGDPLDDLTRLRDLHLVTTRGRLHIPATRIALCKDVKVPLPEAGFARWDRHSCDSQHTAQIITARYAEPAKQAQHLPADAAPPRRGRGCSQRLPAWCEMAANHASRRPSCEPYEL
jgi:imidazolonepropionase-like amidohydrolase